MAPILCTYAHKPTPSNHLSEWTRGRMYGLHETGMHLREIFNSLNIYLTNVHDTLVVGDQEGKDRNGRGRYPKTSKAQNNAMVEEALKNCNTTYKDIAKQIAPEVSQKTIKYRLAEKKS
ncbi:hypothetical protein L873DRAFT_1873657 [Choiromyces venosus 120613-1]|uniref:Resolvase HTH domain-containing protein n=1 Tax=Choiromyces venosus 120613-1 TaxID=1336337 RepID=A0A3N4K2W9_9PEZI|nr:hypothetical protein L873DRAFT_1873657 [Choiromyces venosus 120613-1]